MHTLNNNSTNNLSGRRAEVRRSHKYAPLPFYISIWQMQTALYMTLENVHRYGGLEPVRSFYIDYKAGVRHIFVLRISFYQTPKQIL